MEQDRKEAISGRLHDVRQLTERFISGMRDEQWAMQVFSSEGGDWTAADVLRHVADSESGLAAVNDTLYGLTAGICTTSLAYATDFAARVQAGVVKVNRPTSGLDLHVPFGGIKESSSNTFREQGHTATQFYSWEKTVYVGIDR